MRKRAVVVRLVVSCVLAVIFLNILIDGIVGGAHWNFPTFHIGGGNRYDNADKYQVGDASLAGAGVKEIDVNWIDGSVQIKQGSGDEIEIKEMAGETLSDKDKVHYYLADGKLKIQYRESSNSWFSWFGSNTKNKKLEITVPKDVAENLTRLSVDGVSAKLSVSDVKVQSTAIDTVSGDVFLNNMEMETLNSDQVSGELNGSAVRVFGKADCDTVSGNISLVGSINAVDSDGVSAELLVQSDVTPSSVDAESTSGGIKLLIPADSQFKADHDGVSGSFDTDFTGSSKDDSFTCGSGTNEYNLDTVSGSMTINKLN